MNANRQSCGLPVSACLMAWLLLISALTPASANQCMDLSLDDSVQEAGRLTTLLKIANFRADVKYMGEIASELNHYLDSCEAVDSGRLALVCNFECHVQLGRYNLFMASELPYLASASGVSRNDSPLAPDKAQQLAEEGIRVVDRGLSLLARQQSGSSASEEGDASGGYREFVRQLVLLNALKIRLAMATGDNWYQTVSEARVKNLNFLVNDTLNAEAGSGVAGDPNLSKAAVYYESALWTLIETLTDIPAESSYDDLRVDILTLQNELQRRLDSVNQGMLFLGIDPLAFTSINFDELKRKIDVTKSELFAIERNVESIVERWHQNKNGEETRAVDEQRIVRGQQINLAAHQIGKMEREAREFTLGLQQQINAVQGESDSWNFRQQIRKLEMDLSTRMAEFRNRQQHIEQKRELDLIVLSKESELDRRGELRWLLSWEMSRMNLDLQISSIQSQIVEYERQRARNDNRQAQIDQEHAQKLESLEIARLNIASAQNAIAQLNERQGETYRARRAVMRESICRIENELEFVGAKPDTPFEPAAGEQACELAQPEFTATSYNHEMCGLDGHSGLRQQLLDQQIHARAFLLACVVGEADFNDLAPLVENDEVILTSANTPEADVANLIDAQQCAGFGDNETEFARKMWNREREFYTSRKDDFQAQIDQLDEQLEFISGWVADFNAGVATGQAVLIAAETTLSAVSLIPKITTHVAGLASGVSTEFDPVLAARSLVESLRNALSSLIRIGQVTIEADVRMQAIQSRLLDLQQSLANVDLEKSIKSLALHQTHFQIAGRKAGGQDEIRELLLQHSIADIECDSAERGVDERIAVLKAEHARQRAAMALSANENDLISFDRQAQEKAIQRVRHEMRIIEADIEKLRLSEAQLSDDSLTIASLIDAARARMSRVADVSETVTDLADASQQSTNAINELRRRQSQAMLALSDSELQFVTQRIATEESNTQEMIQGLEQAMALGLKNRTLQDEITVFQQEVERQAIEQQEELMELVSQIDDPELRRNLFIANEETLAELIKGIPEYITVKRRLLQTANLTLHLMRQRYSTIAGITGSNQSWPATYVRNGTQLDQLVADIVNERFFDEKPIVVDVSEIVIPANSAFARTLALNEKIEFEFSPDAAGENGMRKAGYLSLWDDNKFTKNRNLVVLDILVGVQYTCIGNHRNKYVLRHQGNGMVFRNIAQGSDEVSAQLVIGPPRSFVKPFYNLSSGMENVQRILDYWEDVFLVRSFPPPNGPPNDTRSVLPFLGAPVIGSYDITLRPATCGFDDAVYTLYTIFATQL